MDIAAQLAEKDAKIAQLEAELAELKRLIFGQKSERFVSGQSVDQLALDLGLAPTEGKEVRTEQISYERKKAAQKAAQNHPGRHPLPEHLRREERIIEPAVDTEGMVKIGEEVSETLQYKAAELYVLREVRPKYLEKQLDPTGEEKTIIHIAEQPSRPLPKSIAGISLLVHLLISKYQDHLPLYRQQKIFAREGVQIASSTLSDWVSAVCDLLQPLYEKLRAEVLKQEYLMADESRIEVLDKSKQGKTHRGYMWVYYAPLSQTLLFDYQKGRGKQYPKETLAHFQGYLQTDGYEVYDSLFDKKQGVELLGCMAHARRYFEKALQNDRQRASHALELIQQLYQIERTAREQSLDFEQRKRLRQQKATPILQTLQQWALEQYPEVLPKSPIGKALFYFLQRTDKLSRFTLDGRLEIDNNYVENAIRPLALGRKNYLFAGSHKGAQNAAIMYSFIGSCEKAGIIPQIWFPDVLARITEHPISTIEQLLPHLWHNTIEK